MNEVVRLERAGVVELAQMIGRSTGGGPPACPQASCWTAPRAGRRAPRRPGLSAALAAEPAVCCPPPPLRPPRPPRRRVLTVVHESRNSPSRRPFRDFADQGSRDRATKPGTPKAPHARFVDRRSAPAGAHPGVHRAGPGPAYSRRRDRRREPSVARDNRR
jgi:hypothetical protein